MLPKNTTKKLQLVTLKLVVFVLVGMPAHGGRAESYPNKPVRVVVGAAPGGGTDFVARALNGPLSAGLSQPVVIDNRGGAGGLLATEIVAKSTPDGYTLLMVFVNFSIYPSLYRHLPFGPVRDFTPISKLATTPLILVVNPQVPAKTVQEFIALGKAGGGKLNYAAPGVGSLGHLAGELFKKMTGTNMAHVPYKGGGPSIAAVLGGEVQAYFSTMPAALAQVKAGRLRALAVTSAKRAVISPNIPTIAESGVPGYEVTGWFGVLAPAKIPESVTTRLDREFAKALAEPDIRERFSVEGLEPARTTPEEFATTIKADIAKWKALVKEAGIKAE